MKRFILTLALLLFLSSTTIALAGNTMWSKANIICQEYGAQLWSLSPDDRVMSIGIPDTLTNETAAGYRRASQLFHALCTLGGPYMELWVWELNPKDQEDFSRIPVNPMRLEELITGR